MALIVDACCPVQLRFFARLRLSSVLSLVDASGDWVQGILCHIGQELRPARGAPYAAGPAGSRDRAARLVCG
jgi:hypothetical protein